MKKPVRTWATLLTLGLPLLIVGLAAMMITFATLIDVARVNGLPFPEVFPVVVDVGMIASMIVAAQFRLKGIDGRWLAYLAFIVLSLVSVLANANHAQQTADMALTTPWAASLIGAVPSATLLVITHLVMKLIPDEKERQKLSTIREKQHLAPARPPVQAKAAEPASKQPLPTLESAADSTEVKAETPGGEITVLRPLPLAEEKTDEEVETLVLEFIETNGTRPTGKVVGEWLGGKSAKTGQRFMQKMEQNNVLNEGIHLVGSRA
ncbi:DUF2637 domain-containing protein [Leucobacter sp. UCMA 4100]|uniref:DUF2637 domain-containing protein n=1 Tax=Leucobacter sp. UCMA 4100 TaxID=2810534 RepID=UPI0022EAE909|nr:DUF2637 domain-containing protein [Leucobacter sp. UCMA 4100]